MHAVNEYLLIALVLVLIVCFGAIASVIYRISHEGSKGGVYFQSGRTIHNFKSAQTKEFRNSIHGADVLDHYAGREKKLAKKIRRAKRLEDRSNPTGLVAAFARKRREKNSKALRTTMATKRRELGLGGRMWGSPSHSPRPSGNGISHGIGRAGHGHRGIAHELNRKPREKKGKDGFWYKAMFGTSKKKGGKK